MFVSRGTNPGDTVDSERKPMHAGSEANSSLSVGLVALCTIARFHQIAVDPLTLAHQLGLSAGAPLPIEELLRAAQHLGLKAKRIRTTVDRPANRAGCPPRWCPIGFGQ